MDIRQLQYLVALAREKHFTKAAAACNVTQPTLSGRIRQLEQELGVPIVKRGLRYQGLTEEGVRVVRYAQSILATATALRQDLRRSTTGLDGRLALAVVPSALTLVPLITNAMRQHHPRVDYKICSRSSQAIEENLRDCAVDAGLTYLDGEPIDHLLTLPLYSERYSLFVRSDHRLSQAQSVTWQEAAAEPLCLLTPEMQYRRIVDGVFERHGQTPRAVVETSSILNICAHIKLAGLVSILPAHVLSTVGSEGFAAIPLVAPAIHHRLGLVTSERDPLPPLVAALFEVCRDLAVDALEESSVEGVNGDL